MNARVKAVNLARDGVNSRTTVKLRRDASETEWRAFGTVAIGP